MAKNRSRHPDGFVYDPEVDAAQYCRSLLAPAKLKKVDRDLRRYAAAMKKQDPGVDADFWTIDTVREFFLNNYRDSDLDPEGMLTIDTHTDYAIYVAENNVFTRADLLDAYPFEEFKQTPEDVFVQQEIGVFKTGNEFSPEEYVSRDVGDTESAFAPASMLIRAIKNKMPSKVKPVKIAKTKIFVGKERWDDFKLMKRLMRTVTRFAPQIAFTPRPAPPQGLLVDQKYLDSLRERESRLARLEEDALRRDAELRAREELVERRLAGAPPGDSVGLPGVECRPVAPQETANSQLENVFALLESLGK